MRSSPEIKAFEWCASHSSLYVRRAEPTPPTGLVFKFNPTSPPLRQQPSTSCDPSLHNMIFSRPSVSNYRPTRPKRLRWCRPGARLASLSLERSSREPPSAQVTSQCWRSNHVRTSFEVCSGYFIANTTLFVSVRAANESLRRDLAALRTPPRPRGCQAHLQWPQKFVSTKKHR